MATRGQLTPGSNAPGLRLPTGTRLENLLLTQAPLVTQDFFWGLLACPRLQCLPFGCRTRGGRLLFRLPKLPFCFPQGHQGLQPCVAPSPQSGCHLAPLIHCCHFCNPSPLAVNFNLLSYRGNLYSVQGDPCMRPGHQKGSWEFSIPWPSSGCRRC